MYTFGQLPQDIQVSPSSIQSMDIEDDSENHSPTDFNLNDDFSPILLDNDNGLK